MIRGKRQLAGTLIWMVGLACETGPGAAPEVIFNAEMLSKEAWPLGQLIT